jgi:hypothetical protein
MKHKLHEKKYWLQIFPTSQGRKDREIKRKQHQINIHLPLPFLSELEQRLLGVVRQALYHLSHASPCYCCCLWYWEPHALLLKPYSWSFSAFSLFFT